jgi:hypothetical protein
VNLQDSCLVFLAASAAEPTVAALARSAREQAAETGTADWRLLDQLIGEASGKGILRALGAAHDPVAYNAILHPILAEIGASKPIRSSRPAWYPEPGKDPLAV